MNLPGGALGGLSMDAAVADIDDDGDLDIITSNTDALGGNSPDSPFVVYLYDGAGRFDLDDASVLPTGTLGKGFDAEFTNLDSDGVENLFLASRGSPDRLLIWTGGRN